MKKQYAFTSSGKISPIHASSTGYGPLFTTMKYKANNKAFSHEVYKVFGPKKMQKLKANKIPFAIAAEEINSVLTLILLTNKQDRQDPVIANPSISNVAKRMSHFPVISCSIDMANVLNKIFPAAAL